MKIFCFIIFLFAGTNVSEKERVYIGSTPANDLVKFFLKIPMSDSVEFVRWKIHMKEGQYELECRYGISKPNTKEFLNRGKELKLKGKLKKENYYYYLTASHGHLAFLQLNENLIHLVNEDKSSCSGTGGWSYTLCLDKPVNTRYIQPDQKPVTLKDSVIFVGRTPCYELSAVSGLHVTSNCQRLKWLLALYADPKTGKPTTYLIRGTSFERQRQKMGAWNVITSKERKKIYKLDLGEKEGSLYFYRPDENTLFFTDSDGKLLVGNSDFSYTLSKR